MREHLTNTQKMCIIENVRRVGHENKRFHRAFRKNGWKFKRHGSNHDIYTKGGERESVPRHREIDEDLAKAIIKRRGLK